jgi:hypothetical protein
MRNQVRMGLLAGLATLLAGCTGLPPSDGSSGYTSARVPACYWLSNTGEGWVEFSGVDQAGCFSLDSCSGGEGASGGGCYKWASGADAPARPWRDYAGAPACYWLSNAGDGWVELGGIDQAGCFNLDSCSGGEGASGGGCYKWSRGHEAPALPWFGREAPL